MQTFPQTKGCYPEIPSVKCENIHYFKNKSIILKDINLSVPHGEFISLFGPNGGGKTTLLRIILGFLSPTKGSVLLFGHSPKNFRHSIGYVPQIHRIDTDFPITVQELVVMGNMTKKTGLLRLRKEDVDRCNALLEELKLIDHRNKAYGELSGGLAQRALLARALIADPPILILDEPTAHIDSASTLLFLDVLESLRGKKTILLVTHDLKIASQLADRLVCVRNSLSTFLPSEVCDHFSMGLYHAPLMQRTR